MAQSMSQFTDQWMTNPYMFDPTQLSNQFSNYNNAALPWPPTYNTGAGGPVNAATGQPIQSFQQWQQANPGGTTLNATPAQPQAAPLAYPNLNPYMQSPSAQATHALASGAPNAPGWNNSAAMSALGYTQPVTLTGNMTSADAAKAMMAANPGFGGAGGAGGAASPQQQSGGGAPNNWQQAINSLANPGQVQTMGATVPQVTGYQPSGGVNASFLQQAQGQPGMNPRFMSALAAIQGRPQQ